jgi:hypothetical protein
MKKGPVPAVRRVIEIVDWRVSAAPDIMAIYDSADHRRVRTPVNFLTGVCAVLLAPPRTPPGQGGILEVALIDYPGCPNVRVLSTWES